MNRPHPGGALGICLVAVLGLAPRSRAEALFGSLQVRTASNLEFGADAMIGIKWRENGSTSLASGLGVGMCALEDGRNFYSLQPMLPLPTALGGAIVANRAGEGFFFGWLAGQILTNSEARFGGDVFSVWGAQRFDFLLPDWHPRERLSTGIQLGTKQALRLGAFRSLSSIKALDVWGVEARFLISSG